MKKAKTLFYNHYFLARDWLLGFSKRKKERQQKAKDDLSKLLKEERQRQREEVSVYSDSHHIHVRVRVMRACYMIVLV